MRGLFVPEFESIACCNKSSMQQEGCVNQYVSISDKKCRSLTGNRDEVQDTLAVDVTSAGGLLGSGAEREAVDDVDADLVLDAAEALLPSDASCHTANNKFYVQR